MPRGLASVLHKIRGGVVSDCTNGGLTGQAEQIMVIWDEQPDPLADAMALVIVPNRNGAQFGYAAYPVAEVDPKTHSGYMMGGNYIDTQGIPGAYGKFQSTPIPVHDRTETWEQNDILSR